MESFITISLTSILLCAQCVFADYRACGTSDVPSPRLDNTINGHVNRLVALRYSHFGWENTPEVTHSIQLSKPDLFHNLEGTVSRLEAELRANGTSMGLGQFSQYLLAAKAACRDLNDFGGFNLTAELEQKMEDDFTVNGEKQKTPKRGWYGFYLSLGAYCATHKQPPTDWYIYRAIHSQNTDGSFSHKHSVDHTSQAMLSLTCLSRLNTLDQTIRRKIEKALNLASVFLISKVTTERDNVWIGDKYSSPTAVMAIKEHSQWREHGWRCNLIMRSLNQQHEEEEGEAALAQRLMALKGTSYLDLMDGNYDCPVSETTDEIVSITPLSRTSYTCDSEDELSNFIFSPTLIDIHVSIHPASFIHGEEESSASHFTLADVKKGKTLLEMLTIAQCRGLLNFETESTSWGEFITTINGKKANSENREYWAVSENGESLNVGIGQSEPSHDDRISFRLKRWQ